MKGNRGDHIGHESGEDSVLLDQSNCLEKTQGFTLMLTQEIKPSALRSSPSARRQVTVDASNPSEGAAPGRSPHSRSKVPQANMQAQEPSFALENTTSSISVVDQLNASGQQGRCTQLVQGHSQAPLGQRANVMRNATQAGGDRPTYLNANSQHLLPRQILSPQHHDLVPRAGPRAARLLEMGYRNLQANGSLPPVQSPLKSRNDSRARYLPSGDGFPMTPAEEAAHQKLLHRSVKTAKQGWQPYQQAEQKKSQHWLTTTKMQVLNAKSKPAKVGSNSSLEKVQARRMHSHAQSIMIQRSNFAQTTKHTAQSNRPRNLQFHAQHLRQGLFSPPAASSGFARTRLLAQTSANTKPEANTALLTPGSAQTAQEKFQAKKRRKEEEDGPPKVKKKDDKYQLPQLKYREHKKRNPKYTLEHKFNFEAYSRVDAFHSRDQSLFSDQDSGGVGLNTLNSFANTGFSNMAQINDPKKRKQRTRKAGKAGQEMGGLDYDARSQPASARASAMGSTNIQIKTAAQKERSRDKKSKKQKGHQSSRSRPDRHDGNINILEVDEHDGDEAQKLRRHLQNVDQNTELGETLLSAPGQRIFSGRPSVDAFPGEDTMYGIWDEITTRKKSQQEIEKEQMEQLHKNPIFAKLQQKIGANDDAGASKLFTKGLLGKAPLFGKIDKAKEVTKRLAGGGGGAQPVDEDGPRRAAKSSDPKQAMADLFFQNMKLIKLKLEKKKREQVCKLSKDQIKALKEFRRQQREFPFKVEIRDIEEQVKFLGLYKDEDDKGKPLLLKKNHSATIRSILDCSHDSSAHNQSGTYMNLLQSVDSIKSRDPFTKASALQMQEPGDFHKANESMEREDRRLSNQASKEIGARLNKTAQFRKGMAGLSSGSTDLRDGLFGDAKLPQHQQAVQDGDLIGGSITSLDQTNDSAAEPEHPEQARRSKQNFDKMVNKVKERIQRREDRERRAWIDQKTFSAKERFNFDKYDQSISRILIRSQPKFIQQKYRLKTMDEIEEQKEKEERKQTALDYAKKELAERERQSNPDGRSKVERHCTSHHAQLEMELNAGDYYMGRRVSPSSPPRGSPQHDDRRAPMKSVRN